MSRSKAGFATSCGTESDNTAIYSTLEAYPETLEVDDEAFEEGYYSYRVEAISKDRIKVTSWGKIHKESTRLPAIRLTTEWKRVASIDRSSFQPLAWKEDRVAPLPPGEGEGEGVKSPLR